MVEGHERQFLVVALILGPYLPSGRFEDVDGVTIQRLSDDQITALPQRRGITGSVGGDQFFSVRAWFMQVNARHALLVPVTALDAKQAQHRAETDVLPDLIAALHTLGSTPYRVELLQIEDPSDPEVARWTPMHRMGKFGPVWIDPLTSRRRDVFQRRRRLIPTDETASAAAHHLRLAVALDHLPDSSGAAEQAAVLRYYMCIERIVQRLTASTRRQRRAEIEKERQTSASALALELPTLVPRRQAEAIEEAGRALRRNDLRFADLEVREGARVLEIENDAIDEAARLADFRGKHLGHSGLAPMDEVHAWLAGPENRAFRLAALFLGRYLDQLPG